MLMENSLTRPLAVVTGASNGIGYELAKQFAQNGFDLIITATGASINEAAQAFEGLGAKVETVQTDLATYDGVETLYNKIEATGRPVEAIAINAGVGVGGEFARETERVYEKLGGPGRFRGGAERIGVAQGPRN